MMKVQILEHLTEHTQVLSDEERDQYLNAAENCAFSRYRRGVLGPKLVWSEGRLWQRRFRYFEEYERLQESSPSEWHPRVKFLFCEGPFTIEDHGDHDGIIPLWPHAHLIYVINRRDDAISTAHAKYLIAVRRLEAIQDLFWERHREIQRLQQRNHLLKAMLAPKREKSKWR